MSKVLVAYFSASGVTASLAKKLAQEMKLIFSMLCKHFFLFCAGSALQRSGFGLAQPKKPQLSGDERPQFSPGNPQQNQ